MMVDVMSRGSIVSSTRVPASAGVIPAGGSYIGATDKPGSGSRPLYHHSTNMTTNAQGGSNTAGLLARNHQARVTGPGSDNVPFGMKMSMVNPPRISSGLVVSKFTFEPMTC